MGSGGENGNPAVADEAHALEEGKTGNPGTGKEIGEKGLC